MKKISILMSVIIMLTTLTLPSTYADTEKIFTAGDFICEISEKDTVSILSYTNAINETVIIPDKIGSHKVTEIHSKAFYGLNNIKEITIPETITSIGNNVFDYCDNLLKVNFNAERCSDYFEDMFSRCRSIKSVVFGKYVTLIPSQIFNNVTTLEDVTIGDNLNYVGSNCFKNTKWEENKPEGAVYLGNTLYKYKGTIPEKVIINKGTTCIGNWAFAESDIKEVILPLSLKHIGQYSFYNCSDLTTINLPANLETIGCSAFSKCSALTDVSLNQNLKSIEGYAFYKCKKLGSVTLGKFIEEIGDYTFYNCTNLTIKNYTEHLTKIGNFAFAGCTGIKGFFISDSVTTIGNHAFVNCTNLVTVTGGIRVREIGDFAFDGCTKLNSCMPFNLYLKKIGRYAFENCINLTDMPKSPVLTEIVANAFFNCENLSEFYFPEGLESIGEEAFYNTAIKEIHLPVTITEIGLNAFSPHNDRVIYGYYNSYAHKYALQANIEFIGVGVITETETSNRNNTSETESTTTEVNTGITTFPQVVTASYTIQTNPPIETQSSTKATETYTQPTISTQGGDSSTFTKPGTETTVTKNTESTETEPTTTKPTTSTTMLETTVTEPTTTKPTTSTTVTKTTKPTVTEPTTAPVKVKEPTLSVSAKTVNSGTVSTVKVVNGKAKSYASNNKKVATVKGGKVTALSKGNAKITVTLTNGKKLSYTLKVKTSPKLKKTTVNVKKGKTVKVKLTGKVSSINSTYTNTKYAKITSKRNATALVVKGLKKGKTTLKIKVNNVVTLKLKVKVK